MGCTNERQTFNYNSLSDTESVPDGTGPYNNVMLPDYKKQCEMYKDQIWVDHLDKVMKNNANRNAFGYRKTTDGKEFEKSHNYISYGQCSEMAQNFAYNSRLHELNEKKQYGDDGEFAFHGLFARNCAEWFITDIACQRDSVTSVTFYSTLGDLAFDHIFKQTQCKTVCVTNCALDNLLKYHKEFNFESLRNVVIFDLTCYADAEMFKKVEDAGLKAFSFKDLIKAPESKPELVQSKKDTVFTICYTSGTTSLPKGAKLTQNNLFAGSFAIPDCLAEINQDTVHISYLPLAHVMERICLHLIFGAGGLSCFIAGDVKTFLGEDIALTRPTVLVAVPRVLTMFHQKINAQFSKLTGIKKTLIDKAYAAKKANFQDSGSLTHGLYDRIVFNKVRATFGGRVKFFITGSAPLPMEVGNDIKLYFSAPIVEAYGMTEITGALTVTNYNDSENGMAGGTCRVLETKLADRKEMNYHSKTELDGKLSPTGEICCRGLSVFPGYFLEPEKTADAFDSDGWLKTGDVGRIMPHNNGLKIIDRVKELFKLSQGEYIAPSKLENVYIKNSLIMHLMIYGNSLQSYLVCVICPMKVEVEKWLVSKGIMKGGEDVEDFYDNKELHAEYERSFKELAKSNKFNSLETVRKFVLSKTPFTVDNEMLTPTMKLCRNKIADFFKDDIDKIYNA